MCNCLKVLSHPRSRINRYYYEIAVTPQSGFYSTKLQQHPEKIAELQNLKLIKHFFHKLYFLQPNSNSTAISVGKYFSAYIIPILFTHFLSWNFNASLIVSSISSHLALLIESLKFLCSIKYSLTSNKVRVAKKSQTKVRDVVGQGSVGARSQQSSSTNIV